MNQNQESLRTSVETSVVIINIQTTPNPNEGKLNLCCIGLHRLVRSHSVFNDIKYCLSSTVYVIVDISLNITVVSIVE